MATLNTLKRSGKRAYRRVGRGQGSTRGKQSGRGGKGQTARAGHKVRPEMRDIIKKLPKRRGYGKNRGRTVIPTPAAKAISLSTVDKLFTAGDITKQMLVETRLARARAKLAAGDTVRIFYSATPYRGKFMLSGNGTASAPIRVCGVKGSGGERPIIDAQNAKTRLGQAYGRLLHETRSVIVVKPLSTQGWTAYPTYIQIDGLDIRGANSANSFTDSTGTVRKYTYDPSTNAVNNFGACIWVERGQNITIADNLIHDCTNGIFTKSVDDGAFAITKNIRIAGNNIYGNGVVGDVHQHNSYIQSIGVVYEFNQYGPLRSGALGNMIKDRSVGAVVRYNKLTEGAHSIDLVEAEDYATTAVSMPEYRKTFVYGNQITKNGDTGSVIHYGGDHFGSTPTGVWGEPNFRKGTLYFYNNTINVTGSGMGALFQLSTTEERAEIWNNVFSFASTVPYPSLRMNQQDVGSYWTPGGIVNLGKNWISSRWADSDPWPPIPGSVTGQANMITGATAPYDLASFVPLAGSTILDTAQANLSAVSAYPVLFQLDASAQPKARSTVGSGIDLGSVER